MPILDRREVPVPFSEEELERLNDLAAAEGGSIVEFIRACVFGPQQEDPASVIARIEGERIRSRRRTP